MPFDRVLWKFTTQENVLGVHVNYDKDYLMKEKFLLKFYELFLSWRCFEGAGCELIYSLQDEQKIENY